ncbi:hypothetical protein RQP53_08925 [Paucibacter sp. APW11]|uniref:Glycine zipper 2TM domain-containing protein n=1 Tax=Roseateles aquae TaxID=3077235 RepID=A0ABU3PC28_9BURK|nr:hypothetical protein [Paucibacter sp. APW11]MDT8999386.1 hypothetical protein [Paucibacter sp. APW11]
MNHALLLAPQLQAAAARAVPAPQRLRQTLAMASSSALTLLLFIGLASEVRAQDWGSASGVASARAISGGMPTVAQPTSSSNLVRVISATPNLERVTETRQQCGYETQQVASSGGNSTGAAVLGALAGGLIASNVGKGTGKNVAIAAGSATGALIGKSLAEQNSPQYSNQTVQVCRPTSVVREQVRDYTVRYEYQGQEYLVNMPQQPGQWLRLHVSHSVSPV